MNYPRPRKIIRIGHALGFILPASACRDLSINRGDYFDIVIGDRDTIIAKRLKVVASDNLEERRDPTVPLINQNG